MRLRCPERSGASFEESDLDPLDVPKRLSGTPEPPSLFVADLLAGDMGEVAPPAG